MDLVRLQDTTAQIRVRGAMVLLVGFAAIADSLGLESILGAFIAGAILSLLDQDAAMTHPEFRRKLEAIGFGLFIPVFFVTSGVNYDLERPDLERLERPDGPDLPCRPDGGARPAGAGSTAGSSTRGTPLIAGLMQATSLPFIVAAVAIGEDLDLIDAAEGAALIGAGLLSVLLFPLIGLGLLKNGDGAKNGRDSEPTDAMMAM